MKTLTKSYGWLYFYMILQVVFTMRILVSMRNDFFLITSPDAWGMLIEAGAASGHSLIDVITIIGIINNVLLFLCSVSIFFFFFGKKILFQKAVIIFLSYNLLVSGIDYLATQSISIDIFPDDADELMFAVLVNLIESLIMAVVWIPYFIFSKNVKKYFNSTS